MIPIGKKYHLPSVFAITRAEDIWKGVEKVIYADGKMLRFSKRGELPILTGPSRLKGSSRSRTLQAVWFSHVVE